jgi:hypothetical protein
MNPEHLPFYSFKKSIDYSGYKIMIYENKTAKTLKQFNICVFRNDIKIGESESDNDIETVKKIMPQIDITEERGGSLEFMNL